MRKVELAYVEVLNETEQTFIWSTIFNKKMYATVITLNMALSVKHQDRELRRGIYKLEGMTREDAWKGKP